MPDYQKGSIRMVALVSIVALAMAIVGAWWGLMIVPR